MGSNDMTPTVLGVIILTLSLGGLFVAMRVYTRTFLRRGAFGWDDSLIIVTWFIILAYNTAMFVSISHGYGKHGDDLSLYELQQVIKAEVVGQACAIASFPTGKASVAICLMRIFPGPRLRWCLWAIVAANAIAFYLDAILIVIQCDPVYKQWDFGLKTGHCWDPSVLANYGIFTGTVGLISDFLLATIPWFYVTKLQITLREKTAVGVALSFGYLAGIFSILKVYYTTRLNSRSDYAYDTIPLVLWSCAELCAINIAACIPTLRPLLQKIIPSRGSTNDINNRAIERPYPFKTFGSYDDSALRGKSSTSSQTQSADKQILVESTFRVERGSAEDDPEVGWSSREAATRF